MQDSAECLFLSGTSYIFAKSKAGSVYAGIPGLILDISGFTLRREQ